MAPVLYHGAAIKKACSYERKVSWISALAEWRLADAARKSTYRNAVRCARSGMQIRTGRHV